MYFDDALVSKLQGQRVESFPSLWWFPSLELLVAGYVDDIVAAGPMQSMQTFWDELQKYVTVDTIEEPGRYLGRDHLIFDFHGGKRVFLHMTDYAISSVQLYEDQFHKTLKVYETPFVTESVLTVEGYEQSGQLAQSAAQLLMKLLWLARLARPDISYAITALAGYISKWTRNHDLMLCRLLGYVKGTTSFGLYGSVSSGHEIPRLHLFADADLAGDPLSMKSHSGHFVILRTAENSFPLMWASRRQGCVSRSTTEAEIVSASVVVFEEGLPLKTALELITSSQIDTILQEDNSAVISILRSGYSPKLRSLNRTHRISVAALAEVFQQGLIEAELTPTKERLGDIFTKPLGRMLFLAARDSIGVAAPPQT